MITKILKYIGVIVLIYCLSSFIPFGWIIVDLIYACALWVLINE